MNGQFTPNKRTIGAEMNGAHHETAGEVMGRIAVVVIAWIGSITLSDVQAAVGIGSGLLVAGYTALNTYVLWRDRIRGQK